MDFQANFFNDQIQKIHDATEAKEANFEKLQQAQRKKMEELKAQASSTEDARRRYVDSEYYLQCCFASHY